MKIKQESKPNLPNSSIWKWTVRKTGHYLRTRFVRFRRPPDMTNIIDRKSRPNNATRCKSSHISSSALFSAMRKKYSHPDASKPPHNPANRWGFIGRPSVSAATPKGSPSALTGTGWRMKTCTTVSATTPWLDRVEDGGESARPMQNNCPRRPEKRRRKLRNINQSINQSINLHTGNTDQINQSIDQPWEIQLIFYQEGKCR